MADLLCGFGALAVCSSAVGLLDPLGPSAQLVLAVAIGAVAVGLLLREDALVRTQTLMVVVITSVVEVMATRQLGLWDYRLGNLPVYLPALHAVIFLAVVAVTRALPTRRLMVGCALAGVGLWAAWDLLLGERGDTVGVLWFVVLLGLCRHAETAARVPATVALTVPHDLVATGSGMVSYRPHDATGLLSISAQPSAIVGGYVFIYCLASLTAPLLPGLRQRPVS